MAKCKALTGSAVKGLMPWGYMRNEIITQRRSVARGGATVLKVGETNSESEASRKIFLTPQLFGQWRYKISLRYS